MPGTAPNAQTAVADSNLIPGQYIVVYDTQWKGLVDNAVAQQALAFVNARISELGVADSTVKHRYEYALRGFTAKLSDVQLKVLQNDPRVKYIEQDRKFKAFASAGSPRTAATASMSGQSYPWGVSRVGGVHDGTGQTAWILDSGIDLDHPDLNVDVANSASFIAGESADDIIGHGTHVAGILAAEDNSRGVIGVAAGAEVVSVKVIAQNDSADVSDIVAGVNYVSNLASPGDIINMSLGGPASQAIDDEVTAAANAGLRFTVSAGNRGQNANNFSPARVEHPNVWTVSAFDDTDMFASFSNFGNPPIEYGGPGVDIPSLAIGGGITNMDGTSMAAPHLAGLLLTLGEEPVTDGLVSNDPDSDPDPIASGRLNNPVLTKDIQNDNAHFTWPAVSGAEHYDIWYHTDEPAAGMGYEFQKIDETTGTSYTGLGLHSNRQGDPNYTSYTARYKIVAVDENGDFNNSYFSNTVSFQYWVPDDGDDCPPGWICS